MKVSACLVTRGNVNMTTICDSLDDFCSEIIIWDNAKRDIDLSVYGRYAAIEEASGDLIFVQDDDVLLPPESIDEIIFESDSGSAAYGQLVCNMPQRFREQPQYVDGDNALVGFGACFYRDLPERAFDEFQQMNYGLTFPLTSPTEVSWFHRTCDIIFTGLTDHALVDMPYKDLPWSSEPDRMWKQPQHLEERMRMRELVKLVREGREE